MRYERWPPRPDISNSISHRHLISCCQRMTSQQQFLQIHVKNTPQLGNKLAFIKSEQNTHLLSITVTLQKYHFSDRSNNNFMSTKSFMQMLGRVRCHFCWYYSWGQYSATSKMHQPCFEHDATVFCICQSWNTPIGKDILLPSISDLGSKEFRSRHCHGGNINLHKIKVYLPGGILWVTLINV